jgi:aspartyl-tRNA(Asn)/glutamyl-tRNA(Gln) amidotransferase subunit A
LPQYFSHSEKIHLIKQGELSLKENVEGFLKIIEERKKLNAFTFLFEKDSLSAAEAIEAKIKSGKGGKLAGMVIAIKDVMAIKNKPLTCSSKILNNFTSLYTATSVQKLLNEDAIIIGKTNCDEFAMGSSNENSAFGPSLNPHNEEYVPGGSSGGSAVAVAAGLADAAIGTDTGGSVRQPASFCGVIGLKPTYGRISRFGLTAFASSFDTVGTFTHSVTDAALLLSIMSGKDPLDSTSADIKLPDAELPYGNKYKIGYTSDCLKEGIDQEVKDVYLSALDKLRSLGHQLEEVKLPHSEYTIAAYYILTTAEASSNLSRYDGIRYGERESGFKELNNMYKSTRSEGFGEEVKRRIMLGTYVLSSGYYDAYYKKGQQVRRLIKEDFDKVFNQVDAIVSPTSPTPPFRLGEKISDPLQMYLSDIFTTSANLAGIPGISIPAGKAKNNLPIGIQLLSNQFREDILLNISKDFLE